VKDLKGWYTENVTDSAPKRNFQASTSPDDDDSTTSSPHDRSTGFSHNKKSEGSSSMGKGSGRTGSTSSREDGSKPIISIETR